jgi:hypothetical protein
MFFCCVQAVLVATNLAILWKVHGYCKRLVAGRRKLAEDFDAHIRRFVEMTASAQSPDNPSLAETKKLPEQLQ